MNEHMIINKRQISKGKPTYIIAEMSSNHNQDFNQAVKIIKASKGVGADAIKLQTYTPDAITIDCNNNYFRIKGTIWEGKNLYKLYGEAYTPWDWQPRLKEIANELGLDLFSTPFDYTAVDFLEDMGVPAYKVSSFELIDLPLIRRVAQTGKPIILSTGMAALGEIGEAIRTIREAGGNDLALLKCTSAYPAPPDEINLRTIPHLSEAFHVPVGISDHTLGIAVPVAAVALGACIVEKHLTLSRTIGSHDKDFSLEPHEFKAMVEAIRITEKSLGRVSYEVTDHEASSRTFRRSLFVVENMKKGDVFREENVRSIRPGYGLSPRYFKDVLGRRAAREIERGTPLSWNMIK
jgi:pseudaminic acid synthase